MSTLVRDASLEDVKSLSERLRAEDILEISTISQMVPYEALEMSFNTAVYCKVAVYEGRPSIIWGVCPSDAVDVGVIWMMATPDIKNISIEFLRNSASYVDEMFNAGPFTMLFNYADVRNAVHVKWLQWIGAEFSALRPLGSGGELFVEFILRR